MVSRVPVLLQIVLVSPRRLGCMFLPIQVQIDLFSVQTLAITPFPSILTRFSALVCHVRIFADRMFVVVWLSRAFFPFLVYPFLLIRGDFPFPCSWNFISVFGCGFCRFLKVCNVCCKYTSHVVACFLNIKARRTFFSS